MVVDAEVVVELDGIQVGFFVGHVVATTGFFELVIMVGFVVVVVVLVVS